MKVKELIEELKTYPSDMIVIVPTNFAYNRLEKLKVRQVYPINQGIHIGEFDTLDILYKTMTEEQKKSVFNALAIE